MSRDLGGISKLPKKSRPIRGGPLLLADLFLLMPNRVGNNQALRLNFLVGTHEDDGDGSGLEQAGQAT